MMMMVMAARRRLIGVVDIRELTRLRGRGEGRRKLREFRCCRGIAIGLRSLCGSGQVRRDLLGDLLILGRIGLLKLLERLHQLGERRELAGVRRLNSCRRCGGAGRIRRAGGRVGRLKRVAQNGEQVTGGGRS